MVFKMLVYWAIIGLGILFDYQRKRRKNEFHAAQMETKLAHTQLEALKAQLQPHFLFNTLNTISGLMFEDVYAANKMITQLSDLLRFSLEKTNQQEISLKDELDFVGIYLNIQKTRFKDRLMVELDIPPETLNANIPSMLLQPLTESVINFSIS